MFSSYYFFPSQYFELHSFKFQDGQGLFIDARIYNRLNLKMVCVFSTSGQNYNIALLCYLVINSCGNAVYFVHKMFKLSRRLVSSRLEYSRKRNYDFFSQFLLLNFNF